MWRCISFTNWKNQRNLELNHSTNIQACVNSHVFRPFFLLPRTNNVTTFIVDIMNNHNILKLECITKISAKKVTKTAPTSEDILGTSSSKLRNIYSIKSHKPHLNRSFVSNIECITSLFVKIMLKTRVLKPNIQRVHQAAILNFGRSTWCFVLFITQVNHVISLGYCKHAGGHLCCDSWVQTK